MTSDYAFKCVVIGPAAVGKSSLVRRFVHDKFEFSYKFTIGVDFLAKTVEYEKDKFAKLAIWDVGGQERFKVLRRSFYEGTHGALLVFDLSRISTFHNMKDWLLDLRNLIEEKIPFVVLGNKADLLNEIGEIININEPKKFAEAEESVYIETSAKTGDNVEKAFVELTQRMRKHNY